MEDRLSRFLFADYDPRIAIVRPSASAVSGFAAAAMEINGLFAESKILLRTRAVSVHHTESGFSHINKVKHDPSGRMRDKLCMSTNIQADCFKGIRLLQCNNRDTNGEANTRE